MECPKEARAHPAGVQGVQRGGGGVGAAHHAQVMRYIVFTYFDHPLCAIINEILPTETEN